MKLSPTGIGKRGFRVAGKRIQPSEGEVTEAQTVTSRIVRKAPANPDKAHSMPTAGKTRVVIHGMIYFAVKLAMIPATNPITPNIANILILSPIVVTLT
jgi:hypothetical protein